jgi:uncharacterized protein (DUF3084 family)
MLDTTDLPDDVATLKAMLIAAKAREAGKDAAIARQNAQIASKDEHIARQDERIERLEKLVAAFKQAAFGRKSEKTDPDQFDLALEDLETVMAAIHAEDEADAPAGTRTTKPRATNRGSLPNIFRVSKRSSSRKAWCAPAAVACIASARMSVSVWMWSRLSSVSSSRVVPNMRAVPAPTASFKPRHQYD